MRLVLRLPLSFGLLVGITLILGLVSLWSLLSIRAAVGQATTVSLPRMDAASTIERHVRSLAFDARLYTERNSMVEDCKTC